MKSTQIEREVSAIISRVARDGDKALSAYSRRFDGFTLTARSVRVSRKDLNTAERSISPELRSAIKKAAGNIGSFHREEMRRIGRGWRMASSGLSMGQTVRAVDTVGIYVPGGRFSYPSTVLMAAIPARVAGVKRIVMVTPPGRITPAVLVAARQAGITEIYRVGGPWAVAAMAFGTCWIPAVDIIVGPGNAFVNEAKRQLVGRVGIDTLAGPSEVAIIADSGSDPRAVAADACAQAEHDPAARAYVFCDSRAVIESARAQVPAGLRRQIIFERCGIAEAVRRVNVLAPEHLEILALRHRAIARSVKNAGAVFAGISTPTALGDYAAGPSHVLPTGANARFASGLSAASFLKRSSFICASAAGAAALAPVVEELAGSEGMSYHRASMALRRKELR